MKQENIFSEKTQYIANIPVSILKVDNSYQKPLDRKHVKKIVDNFDPVGVGQIHVSKRDDNTYWVFDGQHRLAAYRDLGIEKIRGIVYEGLTIVEESKGYDFYNTIKQQSPLDKEKALITALDRDALKRKEIVESLGLEIDYQRTNHVEKIQAVGAIKSIYEKGEPNDLRDVLYILSRSFGNHKKHFQAMIMHGLHKFIKEYRGEFDEKWLIGRFQKFGIDELLTEQMTFRRAFNCGGQEATKYAIVKFYNHGKRKDNKLM